MWGRRFPATRLRRSRGTPAARALVRESAISSAKLIWPIFVYDGPEEKQAISSLPGVYRLNPDGLIDTLNEAVELGLGGVMLFPYIKDRHKDETGSYALNEQNILYQCLELAQPYSNQLCIIGDCALDPYTSHGHDGVLDSQGLVDNDATLDILVEQSLCLARHGVDTIAPSDMMDGRIGRIRGSLDDLGFESTRLMSYAVKYASAYYGPFRDAIGSKGTLRGDKRSYQMDPANSAEALHEVALDIQEGADWIIIKPGLPYLDIIASVRKKFSVPTFAYQVSGEYQMLYNVIQDHKDQGRQLLMETTQSFFRAGATGVISYFAPTIARWLQ